MKSFLAIVSLAVLATASPILDARTEPTTLKEADKSCGSNKVVACCNTNNAPSTSGFIPLLNSVGVLSGNSCSGLTLNVSK